MKRDDLDTGERAARVLYGLQFAGLWQANADARGYHCAHVADYYRQVAAWALEGWGWPVRGAR